MPDPIVGGRERIFVRILGGEDSCGECQALAQGHHLQLPADPHPRCACTTEERQCVVSVRHLFTIVPEHADAIAQTGPIQPGQSTQLSVAETINRSNEIHRPPGTITVADPWGVVTLGGHDTSLPGRTTGTGSGTTVTESRTIAHDPAVSDGWQALYYFYKTVTYVWQVTIACEDGVDPEVQVAETHEYVQTGLGMCPVGGPYVPTDDWGAPEPPAVPTPEELGIY